MSDADLIRRAERRPHGDDPPGVGDRARRDIEILRWALDKPCAPSDHVDDHKHAKLFDVGGKRCPVCERVWRFVRTSDDAFWMLWHHDDQLRAICRQVPLVRARLEFYANNSRLEKPL